MSRQALILWLVVALLALLAWLTATGRLGTSRHGYNAAAAGAGVADGRGREPDPHPALPPRGGGRSGA